MAAATIGTSKIFPQELTPRFVVITIELLKEGWERSISGITTARLDKIPQLLK